MAQHGIKHFATPAGLHERRCERYIQTVKDRKRSILAGLSYTLPSTLEAEALQYAASQMNMIPNKASGHVSPFQLVTKQRPRIAEYHFGQTGVFLSRRKDLDMKGEWGIFLGYGNDSQRYLRAYIPHHNLVYSRYKFTPNPNYPSEWNLAKRLGQKVDKIVTEVEDAL